MDIDWTVIAVGVAIVGLILNSQRSQRRLAEEVAKEMKALSDKVSAMGERVARIEGILTGHPDLPNPTNA